MGDVSTNMNKPTSTGPKRRVRFQGIVEAGTLPGGADGSVDLKVDPFEEPVERAGATDWRRIGQQASYASRISSAFIFTAMLTFWPVFTAIGHLSATGSLSGWNIINAYPTWAIIFTLVVPVMIYALGYIVSRQLLMMSAADRIAVSAERLVQPDRNAVVNVQAVGTAVRSQIDAVNAGIDDALIRLATVEAMIRQHVEAIETAGAAVEGHASGSADLVARERAHLMTLTEQLNAQADDFAVAIAEKAQTSIDSLNNVNNLADQAEGRLEERLARLEHIAQRALSSFDALSEAMLKTEDHVARTTTPLEQSTGETQRIPEKADKVAAPGAQDGEDKTAKVGQLAKTARNKTERGVEGAVDLPSKEDTARTANAGGNAGVAQRNSKEASRVTDVSDPSLPARKETGETAHQTADDASIMREHAPTPAGTENAGSKDKAGQIGDQNKELIDARAALEKENSRLEGLIKEQRQRADRLADAISQQTDRLSRLAEVQLHEQDAATSLIEAGNQPVPHQPKGIAQHTPAARNGVADETSAIANDTVDNKPRTAPTRQQNPARQTLHDRADTASPRHEGDRNSDDRERQNVSWREILTATDGAEPLDLSTAQRRKAPQSNATTNTPPQQSAPPPVPPVPPAHTAPPVQTTRRTPSDLKVDAMTVIHRLQNFTLNLDRRLYGELPEHMLDRFDDGDRNVFANRMLRLNEADVKKRIRMESARDRSFEEAIHEFLHGFESLLEDATASESADEELEQYLASPLGRVYLLIGATVGYFA